jgi:hypothetical protein
VACGRIIQGVDRGGGWAAALARLADVLEDGGFLLARRVRIQRLDLKSWVASGWLRAGAKALNERLIFDRSVA